MTEALDLAAAPGPEAGDTRRILLKTKGGSFEVGCRPGERLLYAALRAGVPLPYECATGTCGTCKGRCATPGPENLWAESPGGSFCKPERGELLLCQSAAAAPCEITVVARPMPPVDAACLPDYHRARLTGLKRLTHDVLAFSLDLDRPMRFRAGQFAVLQLPGLAGTRAYSMVNHGPPTARLDFVIKRKPGGAGSDWLFDAAGDGMEIEVFGPLGRAVYDPAEGKDFAAVAGGSGIAGMMAILTHALAAGHFPAARGEVFFGVRSLRDLFYAEELSRLVEAAAGGLTVTVALSDQPATSEEAARWPHLVFAQGFVHEVARAALAGRYEGKVAFVAGPPPMVDGMLRVLLVEGGLPPGDIRYDKFQ